MPPTDARLTEDDACVQFNQAVADRWRTLAKHRAQPHPQSTPSDDPTRFPRQTASPADQQPPPAEAAGKQEPPRQGDRAEPYGALALELAEILDDPGGLPFYQSINARIDAILPKLGRTATRRLLIGKAREVAAHAGPEGFVRNPGAYFNRWIHSLDQS